MTDNLFNKSSPSVSIIVCAYNAQPYITATLESLINQTYKNIEILIIDDASTDNTLNICENHALHDNRIRIIKHKINCGLSHARNTGLINAKYDFLTFIDADDIAMPNMIERLLNTLLSDSLLLGVSAYRIYFDDTHDLGLQKIGPITKTEYFQLYKKNKLMFLSYPNLVNRHDVLRAGGYRVDLMPNPDGIRHADFCEDLDLWCRMSDFSSEGRYFLTLSEPLSKYRKPEKSMSTQNIKHMQNKMRWIKDCLSRRRSGLIERSLAEFITSRTTLEQFNDWRSDKAAEFYKKSGFFYSQRNWLGMILYLGLTTLISPKLIRQKLRTQMARR